MKRLAFPLFMAVIIANDPIVDWLRPILTEWGQFVRGQLSGKLTWFELIGISVAGVVVFRELTGAFGMAIEHVCDRFNWEYPYGAFERFLVIGLSLITTPLLLWGLLKFSYAFHEWDWGQPIFDAETSPVDRER